VQTDGERGDCSHENRDKRADAMLDAAVLDLLEALQAAEICLRNRDRSELEVRVFMAVRAAIAKARAFHGET
jgi:hypothetical protein